MIGRVPDPVVVDHLFNGNDMFSKNQEDEMGSIKVTVRLFAESDQTFEPVTDVSIEDGFLKLEVEGTLFAFNTQDVAAYRVEVA